jgi:hypothetical protein
MKIGDLWVKLGLKKDEFDKGIKEAGDQVAGSGGFVGKIKGMKGVAINAWLEIAKEAVHMADVIAHTTQRLGDVWDRTVAGMKGAWSTFISAINSTDFSNLGKRIANSFREAQQLASMKDAEFEVMNSIELQKSAMKDELAVLRVRMQNQKLSQREREKAAQEYLDKVKTIYEQEADYRKKYSIQAQNTWLTGAGVRETKRNRETLQSFLTNIAPDANLVSALDEFKKNGYRYANESQKTLLEGLKAQAGVNLATLSKIANYYQSTNDNQAKMLVDAIVAERAAAGAFNEETRRVQTLGNNAVTTGGGGGGNVPAISAFEMAIIRAKERLDDVLEDTMAEIDDELTDMNESIEFEPVEIVPPDMTEWDKFYDKYSSDLQRMQDLLAEFRDAAIQGFSDAVQELADQFAGLNEINPGKVVQALLTPLADMAIKEGEILIAQGIGVEACKEALESLNGYAAIVAGTALVAIGAAAKSGLAALARSGGSATATTSYSSSGSSAAQTQTIQTEMTVYVTGRLSGTDILLSGQKTQNNWNR